MGIILTLSRFTEASNRQPIQVPAKNVRACNHLVITLYLNLTSDHVFKFATGQQFMAVVHASWTDKSIPNICGDAWPTHVGLICSSPNWSTSSAAYILNSLREFLTSHFPSPPLTWHVLSLDRKYDEPRVGKPPWPSWRPKPPYLPG